MYPQIRTLSKLVTTSILSLTVAVGLQLPIMAQGIVGSPSANLKLDAPSLFSGPRTLTASQLQAVHSMTSTQIQQYMVKIQPTLIKLRNDIAAHYLPPEISNWQGIIRGTASPVPAQTIRTVSSSTFNFSNSSGTPLTFVQGNETATR